MSAMVPMNAPGRAVAASRERILQALADVIDSGWYIHGPQHEAFERDLAAYLGVPHVLGVANGTDGLELALRAVAPAARGTILTVANAGGYTTTAARRAGFDVGYIDVESDTLCSSARTVAQALEHASQPPAAIVVTHLYGRMAPIEEILQITREWAVPLIEDCAQSIGAHRAGRHAGSYGEAAVFSFYPTKNLGALGDAGAVATCRDDVAERVTRLRQYGWAAKYSVVEEGGRNSRLDELQAAVLRAGLPDVDAWNDRRREIIRRYIDAAAGGPLTILAANGTGHAAHLCVGLSDRREDVRRQLAEAHIQTEVHYPVPDHRQPAVGTQYRHVFLPETERAVERVVSLPCFPQLTDPEIGQVCAALKRLR